MQENDLENDPNYNEIYNSSSSAYISKTVYEAITADGIYTSRDSVAAYLCKYDSLPGNYVNKAKGIELFEASGKAFSQWNFNPWTTLGVMIGGDVFSNNDNLLPEGNYREADVAYNSRNRGEKRLVYKKDCTIFYTANHYESFEQLGFE